MLLSAAERILRGRARWEAPVAGMFLWLELLLPPGDRDDTFELLRRHAVHAGVVAVPGTAFMPRRGRTRYLRVSYSLLVDQEEADEACRRIGVLVDRAWEEEGGMIACGEWRGSGDGDGDATPVHTCTS